MVLLTLFLLVRILHLRWNQFLLSPKENIGLLNQNDDTLLVNIEIEKNNSSTQKTKGTHELALSPWRKTQSYMFRCSVPKAPSTAPQKPTGSLSQDTLNSRVLGLYKPHIMQIKQLLELYKHHSKSTKNHYHSIRIQR